MTISQMQYALSKYGYPMDAWIMPDEYGAIFLTHDTPCFISKEYNRMKVNSSNNTVEIVLGYMNKNNVFTTRRGETDPNKFVVDQIIDIREVAGMLGRMKIQGVLHWTR